MFHNSFFYFFNKNNYNGFNQLFFNFVKNNKTGSGKGSLSEPFSPLPTRLYGAELKKTNSDSSIPGHIARAVTSFSSMHAFKCSDARVWRVRRVSCRVVSCRVEGGMMSSKSADSVTPRRWERRMSDEDRRVAERGKWTRKTLKNLRTIELTEDHKATNEKEKKRMKLKGGFVANGRVFGVLAVHHTTHAHDTHDTRHDTR
jgi:hypothetical protein